MAKSKPTIDGSYIFRNRTWRGHKVICPKPTEFGLIWTPEPFFATVTGDGVVRATELEVPHSRVFIATEIPKVQFDRHAKYFAGCEHATAAWQTLQFVESADPVFLLVEDDSDEVYCLSAPMGIAMVFGKLMRTDKIRKQCLRAFAKFSKRI